MSNAADRSAPLVFPFDTGRTLDDNRYLVDSPQTLLKCRVKSRGAGGKGEVYRTLAARFDRTAAI